MSLPRTAVIGAGSSGITALKALVDAGVPVTCFEKGDRVGGNWVFRNSNGMSAAYRSLHINTSRERMEYAGRRNAVDFDRYLHELRVERRRGTSRAQAVAAARRAEGVGTSGARHSGLRGGAPR